MAGNQSGRIVPDLIIVACVVVTVFGAALLTGQDQASWRAPAPVQAPVTAPGELSPRTPTPTRPGERTTNDPHTNPPATRTSSGSATAVESPRPVTPTPTAMPSPTLAPTTVG